MPTVYNCPHCDHKEEVTTAAEAIKRAAAHNHEHHGGPPEITPELERQLHPHLTTT